MHATGGKEAPQAALNLSGKRRRTYRERRRLEAYPHIRESAVRASKWLAMVALKYHIFIRSKIRTYENICYRSVQYDATRGKAAPP